MSQAYIHQIYYNAETRNSLDPGFIPLDNSANERPDWYEFWVIMRYLTTHPLEKNSWYGFLSPKFGLKTGLSSSQLNHFISYTDQNHNIILINNNFDQIAYFQNPFEQGEYWHPGITKISQNIINQLGYNIKISDLIMHSHNFTFSNYIIAKPQYWQVWLEMAKRLFDYIEHSDDEFAILARAETTYGSSRHFAPIKAFIQERMPSLVGAIQQFSNSAIQQFSNSAIQQFSNSIIPQLRILNHLRFLIKYSRKINTRELYSRPVMPSKFIIP
jgi:hypothetical protein